MCWRSNTNLLDSDDSISLGLCDAFMSLWRYVVNRKKKKYESKNVKVQKMR
jgi:hypothetical protein